VAAAAGEGAGVAAGTASTGARLESHVRNTYVAIGAISFYQIDSLAIDYTYNGISKSLIHSCNSAETQGNRFRWLPALTKCRATRAWVLFSSFDAVSKVNDSALIAPYDIALPRFECHECL
jgi:hypothetical protein